MEGERNTERRTGVFITSDKGLIWGTAEAETRDKKFCEIILSHLYNLLNILNVLLITYTLKSFILLI